MASKKKSKKELQYFQFSRVVKRTHCISVEAYSAEEAWKKLRASEHGEDVDGVSDYSDEDYTGDDAQSDWEMWPNA